MTANIVACTYCGEVYIQGVGGGFDERGFDICNECVRERLYDAETDEDCDN
jgi:hypothetical protein